ncbi:hypothetical protein [Flavobacterium sp. N502536]|uniref:hypothetical protein n=1 Tax=Flavobacterium sp. N502536 TaxID=2986837 RepID=UPI002223E727|nr:hypothetical protein [Flavobacterium sp. N502536]
MGRTFRIKDVNGNTRFQDKTLFVEKKKINLMIVLDDDSIDQFNDTKNNIWAIRYNQTLSDIAFFQALSDKYEFKNICIVHHGYTFSDRSFNEDNKIHLDTVVMKEIKKAILAVGEEPLKITDKYIMQVFEKSKTITTLNIPLPDKSKKKLIGVPKKWIEAFFSLKIIIKGLLDNGCLFSVACWEGKTPDFLIELASFSDKKIKVFGSINYVKVSETNEYRQQGKLLFSGYGSILNIFLVASEDWVNTGGWVYYNSETTTITTTDKDLWIYSHNSSKIYKLISRTKKLTTEQTEKLQYAQQYFSKKWETFYISKYKKSTFDIWKKGVETKYPEFKQ